MKQVLPCVASLVAFSTCSRLGPAQGLDLEIPRVIRLVTADWRSSDWRASRPEPAPLFPPAVVARRLSIFALYLQLLRCYSSEMLCKSCFIYRAVVLNAYVHKYIYKYICYMTSRRSV